MNVEWKSSWGTARPVYENDKLKFIQYRDSDEKIFQITKDRIWINGITINHFKGHINFEKIHPADLSPQPFKISEIEGNVNIYFKPDHWDWLNQDGTLNLKLKYYDSAKAVTVPFCLKPQGLKQYAKNLKELNFDSKTPSEAYLLSYKNCSLANNLSLKENLIPNDADLKLTLPGQGNSEISPLQMATKSVLVNPVDLEEWSKAIKEKSRLVCYIHRLNDASGTGFLIGKDLIATCAHVFPGTEDERLKEGDEAHFFFEEKSKQPLIKVILKKIVHYSSRSFNEDLSIPTDKQLDFAIIRFEIKKEKDDGYLQFLQKQLTLWKLAKVASDFFVPPVYQKPFELMTKEEKSRMRAFVVQHPGEKVTKKVSDHENLIKKIDTSEIDYESSTNPGSSGGPVIGYKGNFLGIHKSRCVEFERLLFKKRLALFEMLHFNDYKFQDGQSYKYKNGEYRFARDPDLIFFDDKGRRGTFKIGVQSYSILNFIKRYPPMEKKWNLDDIRQCAFECLQELGVNIEKFHRRCNKAANGTAIFANLNLEENKQALETLKAAQIFNLTWWQPFTLNLSRNPFKSNHDWLFYCMDGIITYYQNNRQSIRGVISGICIGGTLVAGIFLKFSNFNKSLTSTKK